MLEHRSLFFANSHQMEDVFEGTFSEGTISVLKEIFCENGSNENLKIIGGTATDIRKRTFLNCWYIAAIESDAMWKLYSKSGEGVAICSTAGSLRRCFAQLEDNVFINRVEYIDYGKDVVPAHDPVHWFLRKRKSFAHENELRAIIIKKELPGTGVSGGNGFMVPVPLENLIFSVHVCFTSTEWFIDVVNSIMKKYSLQRVATRSSLATEPITF